MSGFSATLPAGYEPRTMYLNVSRGLRRRYRLSFTSLADNGRPFYSVPARFEGLLTEEFRTRREAIAWARERGAHAGTNSRTQWNFDGALALWIEARKES